jgi:hypothetical protein
MHKLLTALLLTVTTSCGSTAAAPPGTSLPYPACVPLPEASPAWERHALPVAGISLRLPVGFALDSTGRQLIAQDTTRRPPLFAYVFAANRSAVEAQEARSTEAGIIYIDGVPLTPERGSDSPHVERECLVPLLGQQAVLRLTQTNGWGTYYGFRVTVSHPVGETLIISGSSPSMAFRDTLLAALGTLR